MDEWMEDLLVHVSKIIHEGDFLVVSEKALSVATGHVIDEAPIKPRFLAKLIAVGWMRVVWGRVLGRLCHLSPTNISRLRNYPILEGAAHKQLAIDETGFIQALRHGSEGGIDASNLPFSLVALPLDDPKREATRIQERLYVETGKKTTVLVVDSDKTYSLSGFHMSVRRTTVSGVRCFGLFAYVFGRLLKLTPRSTPLAVVGENLGTNEALQISAVANKVRGSGAGRTVWDMGETFRVDPHRVTWEMLQNVKHTPIVIVRRLNHENMRVSRQALGPKSL
jgi:F420-0:gamma-glutamyl ligase-like protein